MYRVKGSGLTLFLYTCIVGRLDKAPYGCVESADLWYDNLSGALNEAAYEKNKYERCVYNKKNKSGIQCAVAVHVNDHIISSADKDMIETLCEHAEN